jgi:hypothetical protein
MISLRVNNLACQQSGIIPGTVSSRSIVHRNSYNPYLKGNFQLNIDSSCAIINHHIFRILVSQHCSHEVIHLGSLIQVSSEHNSV